MDTNQVEFRKAEIRPVDFLQQAKDLVADQYWLFVGVLAVGVLIASVVPMGILAGPMLCGIYLCYLKKAAGEPITFELLFKGFEYFIESLIATLIMVAVSIVGMVPMYILFVVGMVIAGSMDEEAGVVVFFLVFILYILGILLVSVAIWSLFAFVYPLIVERGMKAIPAIKTSARAGLANLPGLLMLWLVIMVVSIPCMLCFYLPVFLILPLTFGAVFITYREVFPTASTAASEPEEA